MGEMVQPDLLEALGLATPFSGAAREAGAVAHPGPDPKPAAIAPAALQPAERDARLAALSQSCADCRRCPLAAGRQRVVVARGNPEARLMVIGEGPGAQEDASGLPFVGRAGQLLDQMLASVGLDSNRDAYICNVVKCRPPDNRKPTPAEMAACRPWLDVQLRLIQPAVVLLAGATALEGALGEKGAITKLRGQWRSWQGRWAMPIFHPSYLLRNPSRVEGSPKWLTWRDLQAVRQRLEEG